MPTEKRPLKVFLCHSSADKQKVRELYRYLLRRRIKPWFDELDLVGGQDWQVEIPKALATSDAIIICLTKNSVDKEGYVQKEIKFALDKALEMPEGRIFLIPVRFEECEVPFLLSRYQWVDLFDEAGYARMMRALKFRAEQLERATVELSKKDIEEEKLELEKAVLEKQERGAAEKAAQERAERERAEKATREKLESEVAEKSRRAKAEREAAEKAAREKERRGEATEKAKRENAERQAAQIAKLKETFSKSFNPLRSTLSKAIPLLRIGCIIGMIFVLFWVGSWAMPQILSFVPTAKASVTQVKTREPTPSDLPTEESPVPQAQPFFTEEFDEPLSGDWAISTVKGSVQADPDKVTVEAQNGKLVWNFDSEYVYYYLFYSAYDYEDVRVEVSADNRGRNNNSVSLICRYDPNGGWYEFNIANNGLYDILYGEETSSGSIAYKQITSGDSNAIKQGKEINQYAITCKGDQLTLFINGDEVNSITEKNYGLRSGQVGVSVSSFNVLPILIEMDRVTISEP